jgi:uncharacterized membrane protein
MSTRAALLTGAALTAAALVYSALLYGTLPAMVPVHWGLSGQVDGWGAKGWAAWALPGLMALFVVLTVGFPWLSPRSFTVETFRSTFNYLMVLVIGLMGFIHIVSLQSALNPSTSLERVLIGGLFLFFAAIGNVLGKTQRNFWIGVRTPWTLASDRVWSATHRLAARLMVAVGLVCAAAIALGAPVAACFFALLAAVLTPAVHSLLLYKRLEREGSI